ITATFLTLFLLPVLFVLFEKIRWRVKPRTTILILLLSAPALSYAQQVITLEAAIDSALHNNLQIKSQKFTTEYYRKMTGSAWDIGKTSVAAEWGNINSAYSDTRYSVTQTISFPLVYAKQHELMRDEWRASEIQLQGRKKDLVRQVTLLYSEINILVQKAKLLEYADSVYNEFYKKAELRYNLGASDILEKATAENQRGQISLQLQQLQADIEVLQTRLAYLLQTDIIYQPTSEVLKLPPPPLTAAASSTHPDILYLQQQQKIAATQLQLEKTKLLPEITGGYFNQSYSGWQKVGNVEQYYTQSNRFGSGLIGVSVPIAFFSQGARLKALSLNRKATELMYKDGEQAFIARYEQWLVQYRKNAAALSYYERTGLKNAGQILTAAREKFMSGDIGYLEYTMLINQSVSISTGYYDALKALNETITELNYLANK
ncbi:MAG TPA: TolC family protein, partial [Flavipsychrobacter sp.]